MSELTPNQTGGKKLKKKEENLNKNYKQEEKKIQYKIIIYSLLSLNWAKVPFHDVTKS